MKRNKYHGYEPAKILIEVSRIVSSSLDLDEVAHLILKESTEALRADHAALFLNDPKTDHLTLTKAEGFSADESDNIKLLGAWEVINKELLRLKRSLIVNDIRKNIIFKKSRLPFVDEQLPIVSFLAVPLLKDKDIVGTLIVSTLKRTGYSFTKDDAKLIEALSYSITTALLNARLHEKMKNLFLSTTASLTRAIEAKDHYTCGHSERVMRYASTIAQAMGLPNDEVENIRLSALLHDVGKIGIKEYILLKPGRLGKRERSIMNQHPIIGADIVNMIEDAEKILPGILEHHERFNGKGYPKGLKGAKISLAGRIIAVADAFDALTTNRPYQQCYSPKEAFFIIRQDAVTDFDPEVVKAFTISFSKNPLAWITQ